MTKLQRTQLISDLLFPRRCEPWSLNNELMMHGSKGHISKMESPRGEDHRLQTKRVNFCPEFCWVELGTQLISSCALIGVGRMKSYLNMMILRFCIGVGDLKILTVWMGAPTTLIKKVDWRQGHSNNFLNMPGIPASAATFLNLRSAQMQVCFCLRERQRLRQN